jgi:hypothetical protein
MFDPAAHDDAVRCGLGGMRACCLVEPSRYSYFPAVISTDDGLPERSAAYALVTIVLQHGEARAFFAPGQRFTIWADAIVGHTIQAAGLLGYGVICKCAASASAIRRYQPWRRRHAYRSRSDCPHSR